MVTIAKLPKETEAEIQRLIDSGDYADGTAVVVRAVHTLAAQQVQHERLRTLLQVSVDQYERGEYREFTPEIRDQLWESAKRRYAAGEQPDPDVCP